MSYTPPNRKPTLSLDDALAVAHFSEMLLDIAKALNPENKLRLEYLRSKAPILERIISYDYTRLKDDIKEGSIPKHEQFLYTTMDIFRKRSHSREYMKRLGEFLGHINSVKSDADITQSMAALYREFFMKMGYTVALLNPEFKIGESHQ